MIKAFATCGCVGEAARIVGINRCSHARWLKHDADYRQKFELAKKCYIDELEAECDRRAVKGTLRQKFYRGEQILIPCQPNEPGAVRVACDDGKETWGLPYFERDYSDSLLMFRLKRLDPRYRDNYVFTRRRKRKRSDGPPPAKGGLCDAFKDRLTR